MKLSGDQAGEAFVVFKWEKAPKSFRDLVVRETGHEYRYLILSTTPNLEEEGIPFWVDVMNPMDVFRYDIGNGISVLAA